MLKTIGKIIGNTIAVLGSLASIFTFFNAQVSINISEKGLISAVSLIGLTICVILLIWINKGRKIDNPTTNLDNSPTIILEYHKRNIVNQLGQIKIANNVLREKLDSMFFRVSTSESKNTIETRTRLKVLSSELKVLLPILTNSNLNVSVWEELIKQTEQLNMKEIIDDSMTELFGLCDSVDSSIRITESQLTN